MDFLSQIRGNNLLYYTEEQERKKNKDMKNE